MIDAYVILTPVLLLAVVLLFGFVGCAKLLDPADVRYSVTITTDKLPDATVGLSYPPPVPGAAPLAGFQMHAETIPGRQSWSNPGNDLPAGLQISADGLIYGSPNDNDDAPKSYPVSIGVTDSMGTPATKAFDLFLHPKGFVPPPPGGVIGLVPGQAKFATPGPNAVPLVSVQIKAQTAGNLNVVAVGWGDADPNHDVDTVKDSAGNTYTRALATKRNPNAVPPLSQCIFYASNIKQAADNTVAANFTPGGVPYADLRVLEFSGVSAQDVSASSTSPIQTCGPLVTTVADELIFVANMVTTENAGPGTGSDGTPFSEGVISTNGNLAEYRVVPPGSYDAGPPLLKTPGDWVMQMVSFKP